MVNVTLSDSELTPHNIISELRLRGWTWTSCGAGFALFGIISPLLGSMFTAFSWITGSTWHGLPLQRIGTVLLFLTIPLLILGGHCLDLIDKELRERK